LQAAGAKGADLERFYRDELGFPVVEAPSDGLALTAGPTVVEFRSAAGGEPFYHFALRVPRNRFDAAKAWLGAVTPLLAEQGSDETTFDFDNWNAVACYGHDPCGNIVELIVHRELPEESKREGAFGAEELLGVCEIGLVGPETRAMASALAPLGIGLWDGELDPGRLAFMGGRDGVLILASEGRGWLPTGRPAEPHPVAVEAAGGREDEALLAGRHRVRTVRP
jgi:hypothetical protein